jgi:mono/diheme cytochrome c family protein
MHNHKIIIITCCVLAFFGCHTNKKTTEVKSPETNKRTDSTIVSASPLLVKKFPAGAYSPGAEELAAIESQYPGTTLEKLKEGHALYTTGSCVNCHGAKNIYNYEMPVWKGIIDDMAKRAAMTDKEKDAVFKYVLAIKTTQPK